MQHNGQAVKTGFDGQHCRLAFAYVIASDSSLLAHLTLAPALRHASPPCTSLKACTRPGCVYAAISTAPCTKTHPHTLPCVCFAPQLAEVTTRALERLSAFNRRTLDVIAARLYSYHSWAYECLGKLEDIRRWVNPKP